MRSLARGDAFRFRHRRFLGLRGFEGKPLHAPLTDIPIGAYVIAGVFDVAAWLGGERGWAAELHVAAGWVFVTGLVFSILAIITGIADRGPLPHGSESRKIANLHGIVMSIVTLLVIASLMVRLGLTQTEGAGTLALLAVFILAGVTIGGMLGGELVFDRGYRVHRWGVDGSGSSADRSGEQLTNSEYAQRG
jgi:uncharacterized membrane protein